MRIRATLALTLVLPVAVSCGDDGPSDPGAHGNVTLESGNAATETVGFSGGTIAATATDGTTYTLEIPEGALATPTEITMTPVRSIVGLPVLTGVVAGLEFRPSGLVFATPARLTIEGAAAPGAGEFPIAVSYEGDADAFELGFAVESGGSITVLVDHFSGFGLDFGTEVDMNALFIALPTTPDAQMYANELLLAFFDDPTAGALHEDIMRSWFQDAILPNITAAANDGELLAVLNDFLFWMIEIPQVLDLFFNVPAEFAAEIDQAREGFVPKLQAAIAGNNELCEQTHSLDALRNVIFWQRQAGVLSVDTPANGLDEATVRAGLCAEVVLEGASLPANMQAGFAHSLDFRLLVKFSDGTTQDAAFAVSLSATNATIQNPTGFTDPFGNYTTVITATSNEAVEVTITGNVVMPGETVPSLIEGTFFLNSSAGVDLTGSYMGTLLLGGAVLDPIVHTATITQNQNAVSGTFEGANFGGSFTATLSETELIGVDIDVNGSALEVALATVQQSGASTSIAFTLSGGATINGAPVTIDGLTLSGPDCRWENLIVEGDLDGATIKVKHPSEVVEILPITGTASLTASSFSASFSGGGFSGEVSGPVTKPGQGTACTFIGVDNGSITVCGQPNTTDFCIGAFIGRFVAVVGGPTCISGDDIIEVRLSFGSQAGMGAFCQ